MGSELGECIGVSEGECVGGVDDGAHFVIYLSTGAKEMHGERDGFFVEGYDSHWKRWMTVEFTSEGQQGLLGCLDGAGRLH